MKKRLICFTLALAMLCSLFFTSCSKTRSEEEIINGIVNSGSTALTLSVWIPTDSDTSSKEFQNELAKVEQAINDILDEKNESTRIKIVAVNDAEYEQKVAERFSSMKDAVSKKGETALITAGKYVNSAEKVVFDNGSYMYELAYPDVLDTQLDIVLLRSYDEYVSSVKDGNLRDLDSYIFGDGSRYSNISKTVLKSVFDQLKVNGKTYGMPNNHLYGDEYQYILVNKELLDSYDGLKKDAIENVLSCEEFIKFVGEKGESGTVPFVASADDVANFVYFTSGEGQSVLGTDGNTPAYVFSSDAYNSYVSFYKRLNDLSYVKSELGEDEKAAVMVFYGTNTDVAAYEDEYYAIKTGNPVAYDDNVFASIFAISSYSANYDRSMRILYLLQSNTEIRTLLQYGIKGEDYNIEYNDDGEQKIALNPESPYKMNILYTGNGYATYPGDGLTMSDWENVKEMNHDTVISPYFHLNTAFEKLSEDEQNELKSALAELDTLSGEVFSEINSYTAEQYDAFVADFLAAKDIKITFVEKYIAEYEEKIAASTDDEEKAELEEFLAAEKEKKDTYYKNALVVKILETEAYKTAVRLISELCDM